MSLSILKDRARSAYVQQFGNEPALYVRAPGRVNLIGEHTDYNDGFVLPCAIDRATVVAAGPAKGGIITTVAADFAGEMDAFAIDQAIAHSPYGWAEYVRGMAQALSADGVPIAGANLAIAGDVPLGSGLSSSAALEVAVGLALCTLSNSIIDPTRLAQIAQRAENQFVGCACGIMDQLISTRAQAEHALLIDCRSLACRAVALPQDMAIIIAHSGVRHAHADGEYNDRRAQCDAAAAHYGVAKLRDLDEAALLAGRGALDDIPYRRARHVVTETARTCAAAEALSHGDLAALGALMAQSHASMRDDFEITVPAVDQLADIMAQAVGSQGGARMTGGGFGGCVIAVAPCALTDTVVAAVAAQYRAPDGTLAEVFICRAEAGAGPLT
jgi:galactokinase